jgi:hypothetical protein
MERRSMPPRRLRCGFIEVVSLWAGLLALAVSLIGLFGSCCLLPAAPLIWAVVLLHWVLFGRVVERRRWACLTSALLGALYLFPPSAWVRMGPWDVCEAGLLSLLMLSIIAGWDDLEDGW